METATAFVVRRDGTMEMMAFPAPLAKVYRYYQKYPGAAAECVTLTLKEYCDGGFSYFAYVPNVDPAHDEARVAARVRAQCPFCRILREHDEPILIDWLYCYVVRAKYPLHPGHLIVVAKEHVPCWFDLSEQTQRSMLLAANDARRIAQAADPTVRGFNLGVNVGPVADQKVPHAHLHVIPRREGDGNA